MGRDLQKKKRRSGRQPIRQSNQHKKVLNPRGNSVIAKNWDKKETLAQNYRRLGLVARLRKPAGGTETLLHDKTTTVRSNKRDPFAISTVEQSIISEAKVERDEDGNIVRVIHRGGGARNPLNDPLSALDSASEDEDGDEDLDDAPEWGGIVDEGETTDVVKSLIEESRQPVEKRPRTQSEQEQEWLQRLVAKHGDDTAAMARDLKLNPMQQTAADLRRRIKKMKNSVA